MGFYKKSLGQHILQNIGAARRIADSLGAKAGDAVLEIGPGRGALTGLLAMSGARLLAVEIDERMAIELREKYAGLPNVEIRNGDILSFDLCALSPASKWKVIGNLPYNITSPILDRLFAHYHRFSIAVFTVQREVADRMTSEVGKPEYSSLSIFVQTYCDAERVFVLKPGSFFPPPKVDSAVVRLMFREAPVLPAGFLPAFHDFTQSIFGHRRKTILNGLSLATSIDRAELIETLRSLGIDVGSRPQNLTVEQFAALYLAVRSGKSA